jgi:DNA-directed RNA polymerase specialized sigma24 family protein
MTGTEKLAAYIREHTAARGVDLWAVETQGYSAAEWAEATGRDSSTVARNVRRAREEIQS